MFFWKKRNSANFTRLVLKFLYSIIDKFATFITTFFTKAGSADTIESVCRNLKDNQILADALVNDIEVIVTGDNDLLDLKTYKGIKVVNPKEYWKL